MPGSGKLKKTCLEDNVYGVLEKYQQPGKYDPQIKNELGNLRLWGYLEIKGEDVTITDMGKTMYKQERYERSSLTTKLSMKLRLKK